LFIFKRISRHFNADLFFTLTGRACVWLPDVKRKSVRMELYEIEWAHVEWIELAHDGEKW
jgi:hypothetical protein